MDSEQDRTDKTNFNEETQAESISASAMNANETQDSETEMAEKEAGEQEANFEANGNSGADVAEEEESEELQGQQGEITEESLPEVRMLEDVKALSVEEPDVVDTAVIELLTSGFVERFLPGLRKSQTTIDQIRSSQGVLLDTVQQEIAKFRDCQAVKEVEDTMAKARHYHNKLLRLRREMTSLHEKSRKLKKRALKLQQQKQSEELSRAHTREHELEKERMLTARLATSPSSPS